MNRYTRVILDFHYSDHGILAYDLCSNIPLESSKYKISNSYCPISKCYGKHMLVITNRFVDLITVLECIFDLVPTTNYKVRLIKQEDAEKWPQIDTETLPGEIYYSWENFRIPSCYMQTHAKIGQHVFWIKPNRTTRIFQQPIPNYLRGINNGQLVKYQQETGEWKAEMSTLTHKPISIEFNPYNHLVRQFVASLSLMDWDTINTQTHKPHNAIQSDLVCTRKFYYDLYASVLNHLSIPNSRLTLISGSQGLNKLLSWEKDNPPKSTQSTPSKQTPKKQRNN